MLFNLWCPKSILTCSKKNHNTLLYCIKLGETNPPKYTYKYKLKYKKLYIYTYCKPNSGALATRL